MAGEWDADALAALESAGEASGAAADDASFGGTRAVLCELQRAFALTLEDGALVAAPRDTTDDAQQELAARLLMARLAGADRPVRLEMDLALHDWVGELPAALHVRGDLYLKGSTLSSLGKLEVEGDTNLSGCLSLRSLRGARFRGALNVSFCRSLRSLPALRVQSLDASFSGLTSVASGLAVRGRLNLSSCAGIQELPAGISCGSLAMSMCSRLVSLPDGLRVRGSLLLAHCTALSRLPEGLRVGRDLLLEGCRSLERLPEGVAVGRELSLRGCPIRQLPRDLQVGSDVNLSHCLQLRGLPASLARHVRGHLFLSGSGVRALPASLRVDKSLHVARCAQLRALPAVEVGGDLDCSGCVELERIAIGIVVHGAVDVSGCARLAELPPLSARALVARGCAALVALPAALDLRELDLAGCFRLVTLPAGMDLERLDLTGCEALRELPRGLVVAGAATLRGCRRLASIPPDARVHGDLDLSGCVSLEEVPRSVLLARPDRGPAQRSSLRLARSGVRQLDLSDLEVAARWRIRTQDTPEERRRLQLEAQQRQQRQLQEMEQDVVFGDAHFDSLDEAVAFWVAEAGHGDGPELNEEGLAVVASPEDDLDLDLDDEDYEADEDGGGFVGGDEEEDLDEEDLDEHHRQHQRRHRQRGRRRGRQQLVVVLGEEQRRRGSSWWMMPQHDPAARERVESWAKGLPDRGGRDVVMSAADVPRASQRGVLRFLARLRGAKEFALPEARRSLARRVVQVMRLVHEDAGAREEVLQRMEDSLDACNDKPTWALNQLVLVAMVARARGDRAKLRALGKRVMRLGVVHEHARRKCDSIERADDVCVFLKYEIELRDALDLPVLATAMHFPRYMRVTDEELEAAAQEARDVDEEQFEAWLEAWPEWQRQKRHEVAVSLRWEDLRPSSMRRSLLRRMSLRNMLGVRMQDPVALRKKTYSLHELLRHWERTGLDFNNVPLSVDEVRSLKRCVL